MAKISVIVPVYKVEKYLRVCVDSILNQTFADFDLILVDDGSPDNCGQMCDDYEKADKRVKVIHKQNGGLSDARNYGIELALKASNSEWITFVDSDDYLHPQYLQRLYTAATENMVNVSCCHYKTVYDHTESAKDFKNNTVVLSPEDFFIESFSDNKSPIHNCAWGKLYKKDFFKDIRYPFGRYYEDAYTTHLILFSQEKIAVLSDMLYYYFINTEGITLATVTKKHITDRFDSKICRLRYFSQNNFRRAFNLIFNETCFDIHKWSYLYKSKKDYKELLNKQKAELFEFIDSIENSCIKLRCKKAYKHQLKEAKKYFKSLIDSDYSRMKESSGFMIAILYRLKKLLELTIFIS